VARASADDEESGTAQSIPIHVIELPGRNGKAVALNEGYAAASHSVLVFADVRQSWAPEAIDRLVSNFVDPSVGAVSGDLTIDSPPGVLSGVDQYWRFEKWLRGNESRFYSIVGVTGSICAVRRELFVPMPAGTVLDDVYWPMQVAMRGARVVHDKQARAVDRFPSRVSDEFRRKLRTLAGNYQLITRMPAVLLPWRNPIWVQFLSHKVLRLAVPWALLGLGASSAVLTGPIFRAAFWAQVAFYLVALAGLCNPVAARSYPACVAGGFLVLNTAAWLAPWVWLREQRIHSWHRVVYNVVPCRRGPIEANSYADK
jgi:cellulose synthase/poly-beta-1,6-N-acetylglucosamine synthase-like glycosyltransferase